MLPDFPKVKSFLLRHIADRVRTGAEQDPLLSLLPPFIIHEGSRVRHVRADGSEEVIHFNDPITATTEMRIDQMRLEGPALTRAAADDLTKQLHEGLGKRFVEAFEKAAKSVRNTVEAGGKPLSPELVLEAYERIEMSFRHDGTWQQPTLLMHPDMEPRAAAVLRQIEEEPELRRRRDAIVHKQREEWRVREAGRKLVD